MKKQIPTGYTHISNFDEATKAQLLKDIKINLQFFSSVFYESTLPMTGNFYGPFIGDSK